MKIFEVIEAKNLGSKRAEIDLDSDLENDNTTQDADLDSIPHILQQVRKAIDVDGNYEFKFKDGSKHKIEMPHVVAFVKKYMTAKPLDKEMLQDKASQSLDGFIAAIESNVKPNPNKSIYVR